ncbi:hypothetical protein ACIQAC_05555 [Streptomyces sp. NPDC088387]|uniref:hypothetical protein n=1 Tax=Streptomyces sp. NPDC088387 TaxID=3365859 RepID=UPI00382A81B5
MFAAFFGTPGLFCVLPALLPPLRVLLRPVVRTLDTVVVPVSANLAHAVFTGLGIRETLPFPLVRRR